ncbi:MAG: N-acetyl-alpha-D-glucosaminyl L-malate synthase BshA [Candidatus Aenigmatarchaeota archaeon]
MDSRLTIVNILYAPPQIGGSGYMGLNLGRKLAQRGHNVHVISYNNTFLEDSDRRHMKIHPVESVSYGAFRVDPHELTLPGAIVRLSTNERIDIVHAHYAVTHGGAAIDARDIINRRQERRGIGQENRIASVITNHGTDVSVNGYQELLAPGLELRLSQADETTYVSKALQDEARRVFDLDDYGSVIHNFIDPTPFEEVSEEDGNKIRRELGIPEGATVFYHVSNLRPVKNPNLLIDSMSYLVNENSRTDAYMVIIGDGPDKQALQDRARGLNLGDHVIFTGSINRVEIPKYTQAGDALVLPSAQESFGLVNLEAMHTGKPVIASNVGGIPEVVANGESGLLFDIKDPRELVKHMETLLDNPDLRHRLGERGKEIAIRDFGPDRIASLYEDVYESALSRRRAA